MKTKVKIVKAIHEEMNMLLYSMEMNDLMCGGEDFGQNDSICKDLDVLDEQLNEIEATIPWTDPAGGVHYGDEEDPAAMYI